MKLNKELNRFELNDCCKLTFESFIPKFIKHFAKVASTDIKPFLNTFHSLIRDHLTSCMADEENKKFLSKDNNYDKFVMYVLYRLFDYCPSEATKKKLITCLVLEGAIASKLQSVEMWKNDCAVSFNFPAETNDHLTSSTKSSDFIILGSANKINPSEVSTKVKSSVALKSSQNPNCEEEKKEKALTECSSI